MVAALLLATLSLATATSTHTTTTSTQSAADPGPAFLGLALTAAAGGFEIVAVVEDSPAARAGLSVGQLILSVDGASLSTHGGLTHLLESKRAGSTVALQVRAGEVERRVSVVLGARAATTLPLGAVLPAEQTSQSAGIGASGLSFSERRVVRLTEPADSALAVTWSMLYSETIARSSGSSIGGVGLGGRYLDPLGHFPGTEGGVVHAFSAEVGVLGMLGGTRSDEQNIGIVHIPASLSSLGLIRGSVTLGYTFVYFFASKDGGSQQGIGFKVGVEGGASLSFTSFNGTTNTSVSPLIGPALGLELPSYNPGAAKVTFTSINAIVIPIDGVTISVGLSGSF